MIAESMKQKGEAATRCAELLKKYNSLMAFSSQGKLETAEDKDERTESIRLTRKAKLLKMRATIASMQKHTVCDVSQGENTVSDVSQGEDGGKYGI